MFTNKNKRTFKVKWFLKLLGLSSLLLSPLAFNSINISQNNKTNLKKININGLSIKAAKDTDIAINEKIKVEVLDGADDGDVINFAENSNVKFYLKSDSGYEEATSMTYDSFDLSEFYVAMINDPDTAITIEVTNQTSSETGSCVINYKGVKQVTLDKNNIIAKANTSNNELIATIDSSANPSSQILWAVSDPTAVDFIYPTQSKKYTLTGQKIQLSLKKQGEYTVTASCNGHFTTCSLVVSCASVENVSIDNFPLTNYETECGSSGEIDHDLNPVISPQGANQRIKWEIKMVDSSVKKPVWLDVINNKIKWSGNSTIGSYRFSVIATSVADPTKFAESNVINLSFKEASLKVMNLETVGANNAKVGKTITLVAKLNSGVSSSHLINWKISNNEVAVLKNSTSRSNQEVTVQINKEFDGPVVVTAECDFLSREINIYSEHETINLPLIISTSVIGGFILIAGLVTLIVIKMHKEQ